MARGIHLAGLAIHGFGSHGVHIDGYNAGAARIAGVSLEDCVVELCGGCGVRLDNAFDVDLSSCLLRQNQMNGVAAFGSGVALYVCSFEANALSSAWSPAGNPNDGQLRLELCVVARVDASEFVGIEQGNVKRAVVIIDSPAAMIGACYFEATGSGTRYGIVVRGTKGPVVVLPNRFKNIERLVTVDPGVTDCMIFPQGEATSVGAITLPSPNEGMFGGAQIARTGGGVPSGLIVPSSASDPTEGLREGMLAYHPGMIAYGDLVQLGANESFSLTVEGVDPGARTIDLRNDSGADVSIAANTRLVRIANAAGPDPALIHDDPLGETAGVSSRTLASADDGWVLGYVLDYRYDLTVSGAGYTPWVAADLVGSWVT